MPSFKDGLNRCWNLEITVIELKRVKDRLGVDLGECAHGKNEVINRLAEDEVFLIDVLSLVLEDQYQKAGLTVEQFVTGFFGQGAHDATEALVEAIANFIRPQRGRVLRAIWRKMTATKELATERVLGEMEDLDIDQMVTARIHGLLSNLPKKSGG